MSTHTSGLGGYHGQAVQKLATKLHSVRDYAEHIFPSVDHQVEFWSPRVRPGLLPGLETLREHHGVTMVINGEYAGRVRQLISAARTTPAFSDRPSFRMLQILTHLSDNPMA